MALRWTIAIALLGLAGGFYALNTYIYTEKQAELAPAPLDGVHLGFIRALIDDDTAVYFDDATWLTGDAGIDAAIAAGMCSEETRGECLPNDFFIRNDDTTETRLTLRADARIVMLTHGMETSGEVAPRTISVADFSALVNDAALHWRTLPYEITVSQGDVVEIAEVYVP